LGSVYVIISALKMATKKRLYWIGFKKRKIDLYQPWDDLDNLSNGWDPRYLYCGDPKPLYQFGVRGLLKGKTLIPLGGKLTILRL